MTRIHAAISLFILLVLSTALAAPNPAPAEEFTFTGRVTTGIMAIGGETTGTTISDGKTTYELDIKDALMKRKAAELKGKQVTVKGKLTIKQGVEIRQRKIIVVTSLEAAATPVETAPATQP